MYWTAGELKFKKCLNHCKECINGDKCITCEYVPTNANYPQPLYVKESNPKDSCIGCGANNRYKVGKKCFDCGTNCANCNDDSTCLSCSPTTGGDASYPYENTTPVNCLECLSTNGRYLDGSNICRNCPSHCSGCTSATQCTGCSESLHYLLTDKITCKSQCDSGSAPESDSSKICQACPGTCSACSTPTVCTACLDSSHFIQLNNQECKPDCPANAYGDTDQKKCVECTGDCDGCTSATHCKACKNNKYLKLDKTCSDSCGEGTFKPPSTSPKVCIPCPNQCKTCDSQTNCFECVDSSMYLQPNKVDCSTECPTKHYRGEEGGIKKCLPCPAGCLDCTDANTCTKCEDPNLYLQQDQKTCKPSCDNGYYKSESPKKCTECVSPCSTCTSATVCTACHDPQPYLMPGTNNCYIECPTGYMKDPATKTCIEIPCLDQCHSCTQPNLCDKCRVEGLYLHPDQVTCSPDCPKGTTQNIWTKKCDPIPCGDQCSSCSVPNECDGCKNPSEYLRLDKTTCSTSCIEGSSKPNPSTMKCDPSRCPSQCLTCNEENRCNTCKDPKLYLRPDGLTCSITCPTGYVANSSTMKCELLACRHRENCK